MIVGVSCLVLAIAILSYAGNINTTKSESTHRLTSADELSELVGNPFLSGALNNGYRAHRYQ
jgi:hypothetical protein